jgi:short-subunit dehydrogenase
MNIIIIGATSGIGRALFEKYAADCNRIGIVGRRANLLDELRQEYPDTTVIAKADITQQDEIARAIEALRAELKDIDLAIVSSGTGNINATLDYIMERPTISTNVTGWTFVIDTLYHIFERQGYGHLVAITSAGGLRGEPMAPAYSASKAYQINYMEALRKKAFKSGGYIKVTD